MYSSKPTRPNSNPVLVWFRAATDPKKSATAAAHMVENWPTILNSIQFHVYFTDEQATHAYSVFKRLGGTGRNSH